MDSVVRYTQYIEVVLNANRASRCDRRLVQPMREVVFHRVTRVAEESQGNVRDLVNESQTPRRGDGKQYDAVRHKVLGLVCIIEQGLPKFAKNAQVRLFQMLILVNEWCHCECCCTL